MPCCQFGASMAVMIGSAAKVELASRSRARAASQPSTTITASQPPSRSTAIERSSHDVPSGSTRNAFGPPARRPAPAASSTPQMRAVAMFDTWSASGWRADSLIMIIRAVVVVAVIVQGELRHTASCSRPLVA